MTEPQRIDFARLIAEIEAAGISLYKISIMCHRQYNTVKNWKLTGRVEWYDGEMLRLIHSHYCKPLTIPIGQRLA